ncbi:sigma-54 dependent transcriptional regulator [Labilibaculum sp. DW002]|uniref:Sigma-54 dependent transcriptional regulator n=1 Tax=Paralabilibaculum antarcticum TaxID=2912572 RepID=A0ABT5VS69_9BACT|nr:sigma-54 dependent transcriptional regulator [Labilibaculum sp. DW002]MDE5417627.1 sigma-54 dependent transcriptional regulator [Labilibaculum sp. DW002]
MKLKGKSILIADDDKNIRYAFKKTFETQSAIVHQAGTGKEALTMIENENPDLIFLDVDMPELNGLEVIRLLKQNNITIPIVVITGCGTMNTAIKSIQLGAYEYLTKPLDIDKIFVITQRAIEMVSLRKKIKELESQQPGKVNDRELIGQHSGMHEVFKVIGAVTTAPNTLNVLVTGESGTGKELVARAIHNNGSHKDQPFVGVNCSVFSESLLESELFGYEKGAFTGAVERRIGKLEAAGSGTIFLDEISEITKELQVKLLRVLQEREFYRVGGNQLIQVKTRFIASSNRNLEHEVAKGNFRKDLFYRLNVMYINVPPLRDRASDIPLLFDYFIRKYSTRQNKEITGISSDVYDFIYKHNYPGNVRELENIAERAVVMTKGEVIEKSVLNSYYSVKEECQLEFPSLVLSEARKNTIEMFEKQFLHRLLEAAYGKISEAARIAGVDRRTIHRMLKKNDINPNEYKEK